MLTKLYVVVLHPTDISLSIVKELINKVNEKHGDVIQILYTSTDLLLYERPILNLMRMHAQQYTPDTRMFYIHTKGVSNQRQSPILQDRMKAWRNFMEAYVIKRWRDCFAVLDEFDVCGVNYKSESTTPHFSGNMWWARAEHIARLPTLLTSGDYGEPEQWVCNSSYTPKVLNFQSSHINHFEEVFDVSKGIVPEVCVNVPKIAVYTAVYGSYDAFQTHVPQTVNYSSFYFCDKPINMSIVKDVDRTDCVGPAMKAKYLRVHPFDIPELNGYDIIIYLDGNIRMGTSTFLEDLIKVSKVGKYPLTISKHPEMNCLYHEAQHSSTFLKYATTDIRQQAIDYREAGYPENNGLYCSGFLVWNRKYISELLTFQSEWWNEICKYNLSPLAFPQCQMSLVYCLWKTGLRCLKLPQYCYTTKLMVMSLHSRDGVTPSTELRY